MGVTDLNRKNHSGHAESSDIFGVKHVYRTACFFPGYRPPSNAYVPALRTTLPGRAVCKTISLSRPVSQHGVRTAHLSGEPSGYRSLSAGTSKQALSHGHPFQGINRKTKGLFWVCAVQRRRFSVGASPTRQRLQPEAIGAVMEVTKWLKPLV
jgi:hypothetical protein